ncbi:DUF2304 domain-containing protein [Paenibacillus sp.]|uniref:DUF2304 domain-containing protein n=1 Tax=Paenibacillus sp. TaxID=58172 RepID=UPI002D3ED7E3|nr:DUF2304 domain-containing protein [Paenibacillus sp.]HZG58494.1 DUF2304 domain-containing protein [Paenibacillus sp.]
MSDLLRWLLAAAGLVYTYFAMFMLIKKKLNELNTLVWLSSCFVIVVFSIFPELFDRLALAVGVAYPPSLLFLLSVLVLLLLTLHQSMQISKLQEKIRDLTQFLALQHAREHPGVQAEEERRKEPGAAE